MAEFSIKEAAFAGWGLIRRKPGLLVALTVFAFLVNFAATWMIYGASGDVLAQVIEMQRSGDRAGMADPGFASTMGRAMMSLYLLLALAGLLVYAVSAGAITRAFIRPARSKAPYISFLGGEFRQLLVALVVGAMVVVLFVIASVLASVLAFAVSAAAGELSQLADNPTATPPIMMAVMFSVMFLAGVLIYLFGVRFSLAPAQTEREEAVKIFSAWGLCKGRYWRMTAAYLLGLLSFLPVYLVVMGIHVGMGVAQGLTVQQAFMGMGQPDWSQPILSVSVLTYIFANALTGVVYWIISLGSACAIFAKVEGAAVVDDDDDDDDDDED
jgi:hypothetical protein